MALKEILDSWKRIFSKKKYLILGVAGALGFYLLNVLIPNFGTLGNFYPSVGLLGTAKLFTTMSLGFWRTVEIHSYASILIISLLFGMLLGLLSYKIGVTGLNNKKTGIFATFGIFLGAFAPGCAACGVGLASLVGLGPLIATVLPFNGLELSALSIGVLSFSIFSVSKDINGCNMCQIQLNKNERGTK